MPYFVSLSRIGVWSTDLEAANLTKAQLEERVIAPYDQGGPVTLSGKTVDAAEIEQWRIWSSPLSANDLLYRWEQDLPLNGGTDEVSYLAAATGAVAPLLEHAHRRGLAADETDHWITGPPAAQPAQTARALVREEDAPADPARDRRVMLVHGRDEEANAQMRALLERLGLEVRDWEELVKAEGDAAPYIGDVVKQAFADAEATVVLMTPDEHVQLGDHLGGTAADHGRQARPNVYLEAGMALATHPGRTVAVEVGALRPVTDLAGRHTIRLDGSAEKLAAIAQRLSTAGCAVDPSSDNWKNPAAYPALDPNRRG